MVKITDPAKELALLCESLSSNVSSLGDEFLAKKFQVEPWSSDFFRILYCIMVRIDQVDAIISKIDTDSDIISGLRKNLREIKRGFGKSSLISHWKNTGNSGGPYFLRTENTAPIKGQSHHARKQLPLPKLTSKETDEIVQQIDDLLSCLRDDQLDEPDFIRQALIIGLEDFRFNLKNLNWVGFGFVLSSLKEVIAAYIALERGMLDHAPFPNADKILSETGSLIKKVYGFVNEVRNFTDNADFILKAYGVYALLQDAGHISGLIEQSPK